MATAPFPVANQNRRDAGNLAFVLAANYASDTRIWHCKVCKTETPHRRLGTIESVDMFVCGTCGTTRSTLHA